MLSLDPEAQAPPAARHVERSAPVVRARRRLGRIATAAVVVATATTVWATAAWDADPAVRLARTTAPPPSTITAAVTSEQLTSTLAVRATFGFDGAEEVSVAASPQTPELVATALPRVGDLLEEGDVVMTVNGAPVIVLGGDLPMYRDLALGDAGPDVDQVRAALARLGALASLPAANSPVTAADLAAYRAVAARAGFTIPELRPDRLVSLLSARHAVLDAQDGVERARTELERTARGTGATGDAAQHFDVANAELAARERDARTAAERDARRAALALADLDLRRARVQERLADDLLDPDERRTLTDELAVLDRQRSAAALDDAERDDALRSAVEAIDRERLAALRSLSGSARDGSDEITEGGRRSVAARRALEAARAAEELAVRDATSPIPAFGALVVSGLPRSVVATRLRLGRPIEGPVATVAGARPVVTAELDDRQRSPLRAGLEVTFTADADGREVPSVVEVVRSVAEPAGAEPATDDPGPGDDSASNGAGPSLAAGTAGGDGGRSTGQLVAVPTDASLTPPPGGSVAGVARVRTPVTAEPELVVPAAALHLDADGRDVLRVRSSRRALRRVVVTVVAEVDGRVAVRPRSGELAVGDEVVLDAR